MIVKDWKLAVRLIKHGYELKRFVGLTAALMVAGIAVSCVQDIMLGMCGAFMMIMAPVMLFQSFMGVNFLKVVQSSPKAKYLRTTVMTTVIVTLEMIGYLFATLCMLILAATGVFPFEGIGRMCLLMTIFAVVSMLYYVFSYRFFTASTAGFFLVFFSLTAGFDTFMRTYANFEISLPVGFGIGVAVIILFWFVIRFVSELFANRPLDTRALGAAAKTYQF